MPKGSRDIEVVYSTPEVVAKLRRLAAALETGQPFRIQIAGERILVPRHAEFSIEHERDDDEEEIEFQFTWNVGTGSPVPGTEQSGHVV
ncbi:MAG TPA: amphi-Trp domain-containing protein [Propionibacteriaceae bacterium]|nr:amphi-Trp domain-containing protein [Propionibacteriaceae bacterium]